MKTIVTSITEIPYAEFKPNSVLIVRLHNGTQSDLAAVDQMAKDLCDHVHPTVTYLIVKDNVSVELFNENLMNSAGWHRIPRSTK